MRHSPLMAKLTGGFASVLKYWFFSSHSSFTLLGPGAMYPMILTRSSGGNFENTRFRGLVRESDAAWFSSSIAFEVACMDEIWVPDSMRLWFSMMVEDVPVKAPVKGSRNYDQSNLGDGNVKKSLMRWRLCCCRSRFKKECRLAQDK